MNARGFAIVSGAALLASLAQASDELLRHVLAGDAPGVRQALDAGADVNARFAGATSLHLAAEHGQIEIARLLLDRGADVNALDASADPPLSWAAAGGHVEVAKLLLARGADVRHERGHAQFSAAEQNWDALRWAVLGGHAEMVRLLAEAGARLDAADLPSLAIGNAEPAVLAALREAGMKLERDAKTDLDAFGTAALTGSLETLRTLAKKLKTRAERQRRLLDPLQRAAEKGNVKMVRFLLEERRVNPNGELDDSFGGVTRLSTHGTGKTEGFTALSRAVEGDHREVIALLLAHGARVAGRTRSGDPIITFAVKKGRTELLRELLARGPRVDAKDFDGATALIHAGRLGKVAEAELLLASKASTQPRDRAGFTALLTAASSGSVAVIELLLRHGVSISEKLPDGTTPLLAAAGAGKAEACRFLVEKGASIDEPQRETALSALHLAARGAHAETVGTLLTLGADRTARDKTGRTATDYAELSGDIDAITLLAHPAR